MEITTVKTKVAESLKRIEGHPFILDAHSNELAKDQVIRWVMCAGRESRTFPEILKNMISWTRNEKITAVLRDNLDDELGNGNLKHAHFMHYLQLIEKIGLKEGDFLAYNEKAGIQLATSLAYNISMLKKPATVIGYMLVNEAITPVTYNAVRHAILPYYPEIKTNFFDIHIEVDEMHVAELYKAVEELMDSELEELLFGIEIGERGMAVLLDEAYGIYNNYDIIPKFNTQIA